MKSQKAEQTMKENLHRGLAYGVPYASYIAGYTRAIEEEGGNYYNYFRSKILEFPVSIRDETIEFMTNLWSQMAINTEESPYVRERSLDALALIGTEEAIQTIVKGLNDPLDHMRQRSALLLGQLSYDKAIDKLIILLNDSHDHVQKAASKALLSIGGQKLIEKLQKLKKNKNQPLQSKAMVLLEKLKTDIK